MTRTFFLLVIFALGFLATACRGGADGPAADEPAAQLPADDQAASPAAGVEVTYEPAYPTDVSAEGLSADDVIQQQSGHTHGGGQEHSHGEGSHSHGEDEGHGEHDH